MSKVGQISKACLSDSMRLPLCFDPVSNGEYPPPPRKTRQEAAAECLARKTVARAARRAGMPRREFVARTACGMAACLAAINAVTGCAGGAYAVPPEAVQDPAAAKDALGGKEFIFDIQTHHVMPGGDWERHNPAMRAFLRFLPGKTDFGRYAFVKEIFLDSDTTAAVLSAVPATPEGQPLPDRDAATTREIVDTLGRSPRLSVHALVTPNLGPLQPNLDAMERVSKEHKIAAWKVYTLFGERGRGWWLDDEAVGIPMIEKARALGIKTVCAHKGIPLFGARGGFERPRDIGPVAKRFRDVRFIVYHAGYQPGRIEGPFSPDGPGIDALIRSMQEHGIGPNENVYAELGSTWWMLMKKPDEAAHALGKLLKHVGEDNVVWGTDSIWYGSPQPQIEALRAFRISPELRDAHGYPELTPALKAKILGLNAARVYGIDPKAARPAIERDAVEKLKQSYLPRRDPSFAVYGPRTRREFLALLAARGGMPA
jgi:hypothetical protein